MMIRANLLLFTNMPHQLLYITAFCNYDDSEYSYSSQIEEDDRIIADIMYNVDVDTTLLFYHRLKNEASKSNKNSFLHLDVN